MSEQVPVDPDARVQDDDAEHGVVEVAPDVGCERVVLVNVIFVGAPGAGDRGWVLVDAGLHGSAGRIRAAARDRFGEQARPAAILLTHGHFDHVGALRELADEWDVPVYAHAAEMPFLDGSTAYPPPDPGVGGGIMSALSRFYPRGPIDVGPRLRPLPDDGGVPFLSGWRWIASPGHSAGHDSFWRPADRVMLVGDAFITTRQESAFAVATQAPELHGPPMYYTPDWDAARESVRRLAALEPESVATGHGPPMQGEAMREALRWLARDFDRVAVPKAGRYVPRGLDERGAARNAD